MDGDVGKAEAVRGVDQQRLLQRLADRAPRVQRPVGVLEDELRHPPEVRQLPRGQRRDLLPGDDHAAVRTAVALNLSTPGSALRRLARDKVATVRLRVAENPNAPTGVVRKLTADHDDEVRRAAQENHRTPKKVK